MCSSFVQLYPISLAQFPPGNFSYALYAGLRFPRSFTVRAIFSTHSTVLDPCASDHSGFTGLHLKTNDYNSRHIPTGFRFSPFPNRLISCHEKKCKQYRLDSSYYYSYRYFNHTHVRHLHHLVSDCICEGCAQSR